VKREPDEKRHFEPEARNEAGFQLSKVQAGFEPDHWKPMPSIGPGVREIRVSIGGAFRVINLALWLKESGLNHAEAAQKLGVSESKIIDLERTRWKKFKMDTLVDMAGRAGIKIRLTLDKAA
jgi:phage-related protein